MSMFVNPMHVHGFDGMARDDALPVVNELAAHFLQDRFNDNHTWRVGDVLMRDEYATMHRAADDSAPGERRVLLRTIVCPE